MSQSQSKEERVEDTTVEEVLDAIDETDPVAEEEAVAAEPSKAERDLAVATVVNLADVTSVPARRGRGRPRKIEKKPTVDDLTYHAEMQAQEIEFVESDEIVQVTTERKNSAEVLHQIKERLARQAANLEFRRIELNKRGADTAQIISRQAAVLKEIAAIELKIRELGSHTLDLRGESFQKVFRLFLTKISSVARDTLPPEQFDIFFNKLENELHGWEDEAESLLR